MDRERRYKQRGLQFNSLVDSRALRAVDYQAGRKVHRDAMLSRRRMDGLNMSIQKESGLVGKEILASRKSEKELGLQRYQELLKWREDRRKKLNVEKRHRKPSFKTGVFQPDQAKFLVSDDVQDQDSTKLTTPSKAAPFKYLQRSSSKLGFTPETSTRKISSCHKGVTPGTSATIKIPKFNLGITPNQFGRASLCRKNVQKENVHCNPDSSQKVESTRRTRTKVKAIHSIEMKRILRGRGTRRREVTINVDDLGVKNIPLSPGPVHPSSEVKPSSEDFTSSKVSSFAPQNYAFNFSVQNRVANDAITKSEFFTNEDISSDELPDKPYFSKSAVEEKDDDDGDDAVTNDFEPNLNIVKTVEDEDDDYGDNGIEETVEDDDKGGVNEIEDVDKDNMMEEMNQVNKIKEKMEETSVENEECWSTVKKENVNDLKYCRNIDDVFHCVPNTPKHVHRRSTRQHSTRRSHCADTSITPLMSKLRPRTPCSRSTRRSQNAHVDYRSDRMCTPGNRSSKRKSVRRSVNAALKIGDIEAAPIPFNFNELPSDDSVNPLDETSTEHNSILFKDEHKIEEETAGETAVATLSECITNTKGEENKNQETPKLETKEMPKLETKEMPKLKTKRTPKLENKRTPKPGNKQIPRLENEQTPRPENEQTPRPENEQTPRPENEQTPSTSRRRGKVSWMVTESPYINVSKRSGKSRRSGVPSDITALFDDIPTDGSPLPAHLTPLLNKSLEQGMSAVDSTTVQDEHPASSPSEDQACSNLLELLKPSTPARNDTPDIDVWGEESPDKADDSIIKPAAETNTDSVVPVITDPPVTRRKSCRVSLLSGMIDSPMEVGKLSIVSEDLISWETPMTSRETPMTSKKKTKVAKEKSMVTPSRRSSRRASKICLQ